MSLHTFLADWPSVTPLPTNRDKGSVTAPLIFLADTEVRPVSYKGPRPHAGGQLRAARRDHPRRAAPWPTSSPSTARASR